MLPQKPKDYKPEKINVNLADWGEDLPNISPIFKNQNHKTYVLPPARPSVSQQKRLMKTYEVTSPTEYSQFEQLASTMLTMKQPNSTVKDHPRILLQTDFSCNSTSFMIIRPYASSTLAQNLTTLGLMRIFDREQIWKVISDVVEAVRDLNEMQLCHLGIKPENIVLCEDKTYRLTDVIFNDYVIRCVKKEELDSKAELMKLFPHLESKTDHTVVIFNKTGNEYIHTKNLSQVEERRKKAQVQTTVPQSVIVGSKRDLTKHRRNRFAIRIIMTLLFLLSPRLSALSTPACRLPPPRRL